MKSYTAALVTVLSARTAAHGVVTKIIVGGTSTYQGYNPTFQYMPTPPPTIGWTAPSLLNLGPVDGNKLDSGDMICASGATPAKMAAPVAAGEKVSLQWTTWPSSHHGPMITYLANCNGDCSTVDPSTLKFFKIDEAGMKSTQGSPPLFADDDMIKNDNTWEVTIPSSIKAGNYVLRHETIALHQANVQGGAQPYPQCVNIEVTGGGSDTPAGVAGWDLYYPSEPGILFNIYSSFSNTAQYTVPGPTLYSGAAAGAATAPTPTASSASAVAVKPSGSGGVAKPSTAAKAISDSTSLKIPACKKRHTRRHAKDVVV